MSRELATVHVQYIPAGNTDFDTDEFQYLDIDDNLYIAGHGTPYDSADGDCYTADAIGISLMPIGPQSSKHRQDSSILWYLYSNFGFEDVYNDVDVGWFIQIASKLRKDSDPLVSFVVVFDCDVEPDTDNWTGYTHGEPYAELTHYCNAETLEWIEVGK